MASTKDKLRHEAGTTERGQHSYGWFKLSFDGTDPVYIEMDTLMQGGISVLFDVEGDKAGLTGNLTYNLQVSNDRVLWTDVAYKVDGVEVAAGGETVAVGDRYVAIVTYADYPLTMAYRYFRLYVDSSVAQNLDAKAVVK